MMPSLRRAPAVAVLVLSAGVAFPALSCLRKGPPRQRCAANLKKIGIACQLYAAGHGGVFPGCHDTLFADDYIRDPKVFECPVRRRNHPEEMEEEEGWDLPMPNKAESYLVVSGLRADDPPEYVLDFDEEWNHDGRGINVLYVGGNVEWVTDIAGFHVKLEKQQAELTAAGRKMEVPRPWWSEYPDRPAYVGRPAKEVSPSTILTALAATGGIAAIVLGGLVVRAAYRRDEER